MLHLALCNPCNSTVHNDMKLDNYIYTDDNSDSNNPNDYIVLRGPIDIEREVYAPGINWIYRITKYDAPEGSSKPYAEATLVLGPVHSASGP